MVIRPLGDPANLPLYGSYGINGWMYNPPSGSVANGTNYWRKLSAAFPGHNVPLFADCNYDGSTPTDTDQPPPVANEQIEGTQGDMSLYSITRHDGQRPVTMSFVDSSVRSVGLKELWTLGWSTTFDTNYANRLNRWPLWMKCIPINHSNAMRGRSAFPTPPSEPRSGSVHPGRNTGDPPSPRLWQDAAMTTPPGT